MSGRSPESVAFGPFRFVVGDGLWRDGRVVPLPPRAIGVLAALLATPGEVVTKQQLMDAVWPGTFVTESSLLEAIGLLRDTLGDDRKQPTYIQTVHRRGYRFIGDVTLDLPAAAHDHVAPPKEPQTSVFNAAYAAAAICLAITAVVV